MGFVIFNNKTKEKTMTTQELTQTIRELKELKAMAADLTAEITTLEDIIKAEMIVRNLYAKACRQ